MTKGYLHIITIPISGDIYIDNEYRGSKSINIETDPGSYNISFGDITGYITPVSRNEIVSSGMISEITVDYKLK